MSDFEFFGSTIKIDDDKYGNLTEMFVIGNANRLKRGLPTIALGAYLKSDSYLTLIHDLSIKPIYRKVGRYGGGTWAHIYILLDAAARMDADFKVKMFDILVEGKLLEWRDDSGESYKALNIVLDLTVQKSDNVKPPKEAYVALAMAIRLNVLGDVNLNWNEASYDQLRRRTIIENQLISIMKLNLVRDFKHLIEIAENL